MGASSCLAALESARVARWCCSSSSAPPPRARLPTFCTRRGPSSTSRAAQVRGGEPARGASALTRPCRCADKVREEIEGETSRSLGVGKAVSAEPIMLTIRSPNVPNLTLVDMVRRARRGPFPGQFSHLPPLSPARPHQDCHRRSAHEHRARAGGHVRGRAGAGRRAAPSRALSPRTRAYIKSENVIILAVSPANADIATSDAMRLVREYDSGGERTIGVLVRGEGGARRARARSRSPPLPRPSWTSWTGARMRARCWRGAPTT